MQQVTLRYKPFIPFEAFHARDKRFAVLICTRRAGKTVAVINDLVTRALRTRKVAPGVPPPRYAYVAPYLKQAKNAAWIYLKQIALELQCKTNETDLALLLPNGATVRVYGADNPDSFRGAYFDGVVLDEFGDMKAATWTTSVRPALADRQGWAVFIGTPRGKNAFYRIREKAKHDTTGRWFYLELPASKIIAMGGPKTGWGVLTQTELDDAKQDMEHAEFMQEFECDFEAANVGSYYGQHIQSVDARSGIRRGAAALDLFDKNEKVCVSHDPGRNDAWAVWFWQMVDGEFRVIDYWEETGYDAEEVLEVLSNKPYDYEMMWVPHDALHKTAQSKKSILDMFRDAGVPTRKVPNPDAGNSILNGVGAVRKVLRTYPIVFDGDRCAAGIHALREYSRKWDRDAGVFSETPKHDKHSNGADSFRYACLSINQEDLKRSQTRAKKRRQQQAMNPHAELNMNEIVREAFTFDDAVAAHRQQAAARREEGWT